MYLSIPRPTFQEIDDTLSLMDHFLVDFESFLTKQGQDHTGIEMTAHLRRLVHNSRGALVPRVLVLKLGQRDREAPPDVLQGTRNELDVFIERTAGQRQDRIRHSRDGHLMSESMVVFNVMFAAVENAAFAPANDASLTCSYEDFIFKFYEKQCEEALKKIRAILRKQKIDPHCFTVEMDLYDSGGPSGTACLATYNIIQHGNLSSRKQRLLDATVREVTGPFQEYVDMPSLYVKARNEGALSDD